MMAESQRASLSSLSAESLGLRGASDGMTASVMQSFIPACCGAVVLCRAVSCCSCVLKCAAIRRGGIDGWPRALRRFPSFHAKM